LPLPSPRSNSACVEFSHPFTTDIFQNNVMLGRTRTVPGLVGRLGCHSYLAADADSQLLQFCLPRATFRIVHSMARRTSDTSHLIL
jgi:hypothetical protein